MKWASINISEAYAKDVTFTEFKKNSVIATLSEKEQIELYELKSGKKVPVKKVKTKKEED